MQSAVQRGPVRVDVGIFSKSGVVGTGASSPAFSLVKAAQSLPASFPCSRSDPANRDFTKERTTATGGTKILTAFDRISQ
jgi:hypothetical protein